MLSVSVELEHLLWVIFCIYSFRKPRSRQITVQSPSWNNETMPTSKDSVDVLFLLPSWMIFEFRQKFKKEASSPKRPSILLFSWPTRPLSSVEAVPALVYQETSYTRPIDKKICDVECTVVDGLHTQYEIKGFFPSRTRRSTKKVPKLSMQTKALELDTQFSNADCEP